MAKEKIVVDGRLAELYTQFEQEIQEYMNYSQDKKKKEGKRSAMLEEYCASACAAVLDKPQIVDDFPTFLPTALLGQLQFLKTNQWLEWYEKLYFPSLEELRGFLNITDTGRKIISFFSNKNVRSLQQTIFFVFVLEHRQMFKIVNQVVYTDSFNLEEEEE